MNPQHPQWPGRPPQAPAPVAQRPERPADVDTGFWLWLAAVPLMVIGKAADGYVLAQEIHSPAVMVTSTMMAVVAGVVVVTFIVLMRGGYRWTRTVLTAGGVATIFYTASNLFGTPRPPVPAVIYAVTGIIGAVLIGGGIVLLHRADSTRFFDR